MLLIKATAVYMTVQMSIRTIELVDSLCCTVVDASNWIFIAEGALANSAELTNAPYISILNTVRSEELEKLESLAVGMPKAAGYERPCLGCVY